MQHDLPTGRPPCFSASFQLLNIKSVPKWCVCTDNATFTSTLLGLAAALCSFQGVYITRKVNNLGQQMVITLEVNVRLARRFAPAPPSRR